MVGNVLTERTVSEVKPAVKDNMAKVSDSTFRCIKRDFFRLQSQAKKFLPKYMPFGSCSHHPVRPSPAFEGCSRAQLFVLL
jgi:hypothetical protein